MINNIWEEQTMEKAILDFHEKEMGKVCIPEWIQKIKCPFCKKDVPLRSIYSFGLKLNARNLGDFFVEILCDDCNKMDTLYFRQEVGNIEDLCSLLKAEKEPRGKPFIEEDMYKMGYNNIIEKMVNKKEKD